LLNVKKIISIGLLVFVACKSDIAESSSSSKDSISSELIKEVEIQDKVRMEGEFYMDSLIYSPLKKVRLEVNSIYSKDELSIRIFKDGILIQKIDSLFTPVGWAEPDYIDFNLDGLFDLKFHAGTGVRGSNELSHVYLQDPASSRLIKLRGSEGVPNLYVDSVSQKVTATFYYGGTTFIDYKIVGDSLIEIEETEVSSDKEFTYRNTCRHLKGERVLLKKDSVADGGQGLFGRE